MSLSRKWTLIVGPTNSGKTYQAMQILKKAKSGLYLAPLRLLALENYESMLDKGMPAFMQTGEELLGDPTLPFGSCTIEMLAGQPQKEVVVIDEAQLLQDPDRGWAWTQALNHAKCQHLVVCATLWAKDALIQWANRLGEPIEIIQTQRRKPLDVAQEHISLNKLKAKDALIAFSRKEVLTYAQQLSQMGKKVSVIYGALAPEVRRNEAQRFLTGQSDILVATDAIGMGLNLPIERVVFSSLRKYDGNIERLLFPSELQQIAGRAGRMESMHNGLVSSLDFHDLSMIEYLLNVSIPSLKAPFYLMPQIDSTLSGLWHEHIQIAKKQQPLLDCFQWFDTSDMERKSTHFRKIPITLKDQSWLVHLPLDLDKPWEATLFHQMIQAFAQKAPLCTKSGFVSQFLSTIHPKVSKLEQQEIKSKGVAAILWAAQRWPFEVHLENLSQTRKQIENSISKTLESQQFFSAIQQAFSKALHRSAKPSPKTYKPNGKKRRA